MPTKSGVRLKPSDKLFFVFIFPLLVLSHLMVGPLKHNVREEPTEERIDHLHPGAHRNFSLKFLLWVFGDLTDLFIFHI